MNSPHFRYKAKTSTVLTTVLEREALKKANVHVRLGEAGGGVCFGQVRLDAGCNTIPLCHLWKSPDVHSNKKGSRARLSNKKKKNNQNPNCNIWN